MRTPFFGGFDVGRSKNLADCQLINLYPEVVENQDGKDVGAFYMAPGLTLKSTIGTGPVRGLYALPGVPFGMIGVSGSAVWVFDSNFDTLQIGTMGTNSGPVSIIDNGGQAAIFDGQSGYVLNGLDFSSIALPANFPASACIQDGFGIVTEAGSANLWQSNLDDLSTFNPLTFSVADSTPDPVVAVVSLHRVVCVLKTKSIEFWYDAGLPNFAFARVDGVSPNMGCAAAASATPLGERVAWLSQNAEGQGIVVAANNYQPVRISNHAVEYLIATFPRIDDALAFSYQQGGHLFYQLTFPTADVTLVYDATASEQVGRPMWHRRAEWLNGHYHRHWANCYTTFLGINLVGDYRNGNIYAYDLNNPTDNGAQRKWLRSWRALQKPQPTPLRFPALQIDMETGGLPPGQPIPSVEPQAVLRWTDDGGHNWSDERFVGVGNIGQTGKRVRFNRLGSTRRNSGLDRIFELSSTDVFNVALIGADLVEQE